MTKRQAKRYEVLQKMAAAGAESARELLKKHGGAIVYCYDGMIVQELPDGTLIPLEGDGIPIVREEILCVECKKPLSENDVGCGWKACEECRKKNIQKLAYSLGRSGL